MNRLVPALIFALSLAVYGLYGFRGELTRDQAIYMYSGQRLTQGVLPYVSIFDHKGPLALMLTAPGVWLAQTLEWDDLLMARLLFLGFAGLTVALIYRLGEGLLGARTGLFAALTCLGFVNVARNAASGPHPKTAMLLFETLSLLCMVQRRWFWAGVAGSLAGLIWQPAAVFAVTTLILAAVHPRGARRRAVALTGLGIGLPVIAVAAVFAARGALPAMLDGAVLFNLRYLDRWPGSLAAQAINVIGDILAGYRMMVLPIGIGLFMMGVIYIWRRLQHPSAWETLTRDPFSPLFLSLPVPVAWSVVDFQGPPDLYIFLPFVALGFARFLDLAASHIAAVHVPGAQSRNAQRASTLVTAGLSAVLVAGAVAGVVAEREAGLDSQRAAAMQILTRFGARSRYLSLGTPEFFVLVHQVNPNPYLFIVNGIDRRIAAGEPDGFEGWLRSLEAYDPEVIMFGLTRGAYRNKLVQWLAARYQEERIGGWRLYVKSVGAGP